MAMFVFKGQDFLTPLFIYMAYATDLIGSRLKKVFHLGELKWFPFKFETYSTMD